jgi:hypothetical protein
MPWVRQFKPGWRKPAAIRSSAAGLALRGANRLAAQNERDPDQRGQRADLVDLVILRRFLLWRITRLYTPLFVMVRFMHKSLPGRDLPLSWALAAMSR